MHIDIRKLTPALTDAYVRFFETTPHADHREGHICYCVWWCSDDYEGKDLTVSEAKRRDYAVQCVKNGYIQGYLAFYGGKAAGWCNANTKMDCLRCYCWRRYMGSVPTQQSAPDVRVKSIFCFAVTPELRRSGIASRLVERVCLDAASEGFDFVEAYPNKAFADEAVDYMGPAALFRKHGFTLYFETETKLVMRKSLK